MIKLKNVDWKKVGKVYLLVQLVYIELLILKGMVLLINNNEKKKLDQTDYYHIDKLTCNLYRQLIIVKIIAVGITIVFYDFVNYFLFKFMIQSRKAKQIVIAICLSVFIIMISMLISAVNPYLSVFIIGILEAIHLCQIFAFFFKEQSIIRTCILVFYITLSVQEGMAFDAYEGVPFYFLGYIFTNISVQITTLLSFYVVFIIICYFAQRKLNIFIIFNYTEEQSILQGEENDSFFSFSKAKLMINGIKLLVLAFLFAIVFMNSNLLILINALENNYLNLILTISLWLVGIFIVKYTISFVTSIDFINIFSIVSCLVYLILLLNTPFQIDASDTAQFSFDFIPAAFTIIGIVIISLNFSENVKFFKLQSIIKLSIGFFLISLFIQYYLIDIVSTNYSYSTLCSTESNFFKQSDVILYGVLNITSIFLIYLFRFIIKKIIFQKMKTNQQKLLQEMN